MKKDKFVTETIKEQAGQFVPVSEAKMIAIGKERMGNCEACGHTIKNHYGVYNQKNGYMWVGSCCAKLLCSEDSVEMTIEPGTQVEINGREMVSLTQAEFDSLSAAAWEGGQVHIGSGVYQYHPMAYTKNQFVAGILHNVMRYSPIEKLVTKKQYESLLRNI